MLNGKRYIVTGTSGWLGEGIALELIKAGAEVICHHRSTLPQSLQGQSEVKGELTQFAEIERIAHEVRERFGQIDGLVNNAAAQPVTPFLEISESEYDLVMDSGVKSAFFLMQKLAPLMKSGSIVNIASIEGENAPPGHSHYGAAKAALLSLTKTAALELAPIRVNAVLPGLIDRPGLAEQWPEGVARWIEKAPSKKLVTRQEVASAVLYCLQAPNFTGASVRVDGGIGATGW